MHITTGKTGEESTVMSRSDLLSLIISGPNICTLQLMNGAASVYLYCGRSAIVWYPIFTRILWHITHLCIGFNT